MDPAEYPSHATNVEPSKRWAKVLNEVWPKPEVARQLREYELDQQVPVTVRLVFETGEEHLDGDAVWWWNRVTKHVRVNVMDERVQTGGVWMNPDDVTRR